MIKIVFKNGTTEEIENCCIEYILSNRKYRLIEKLVDTTTNEEFLVTTELNEKNLIKIVNKDNPLETCLFYNDGYEVDFLSEYDYDYEKLLKDNVFI